MPDVTHDQVAEIAIDDVGGQPGARIEDRPKSRTGAADPPGLVDGLKRGDADAYRRFVERHHGAMYSIAYRFLGSREDAQDCVQDVCLTVVQKIGGFEGGCALSTWVHRIVVNRAISRLRSRKPVVESDVEQFLPRFREDGHLQWPLGGEVRPLDELLESEQVKEKIRAAIDALPADYREVVLLRDYLGYSTRESAEILDISPGALKVRLHRARSIMKGMLQSEFLEGER